MSSGLSRGLEPPHTTANVALMLGDLKQKENKNNESLQILKLGIKTWQGPEYQQLLWYEEVPSPLTILTPSMF